MNDARTVAIRPSSGRGSLQTRLLAAFVLVILVTLLSAGSAVVWLIQDYQRRLAVDRLSEVAIAASLVGRQLEQQEARPEDIGAVLANQLAPTQINQVHILVLDPQGRVLVERPSPAGGAEPAFLGRRLEVPPAGAAPPFTGRPSYFRAHAIVWTEASDVPGRPYIFVTSPWPVGPAAPSSGAAPGAEPRQEPFDRFLARRPVYRVVLATPQRNLALVWRELAPSLGLAALIAVPVSVAVALWLARSITRPLRQITRAAEGIARGELRQTIPLRGGDEVAHLAQAFNTMSREVERSHRALRDFLANASHELRTPLTSIQGFSQALHEGTLQGEDGALEAGRIINEEAHRMRGLVEDLLYLSRVESREAPASRAPVDVAGLLREGARRLEVTAERRGLRLTFELPDLPLVLGDADQLDRLFGNLLDNAGKYTPDGGAVSVTAWTERGDVCVAVRNTGSFIPAEDLPHVFERFYRVEKSRAREVEGSGLGLAIAHEVVERHGGSISVTSDRATGTSFRVRLPAARTAALGGERGAAQSAAGPPPRRPREGAPAASGI